MQATLVLALVLATQAAAQDVVPASDATKDSQPAVAATEAPVSEIILQSGRFLRGRIVRSDDEAIILQLEDGAELKVAVDTISEIKTPGAPAPLRPQEKFSDPNRTRYFWSQSAMTLKAGEVYVSQKELLLTEVGVGITDQFSIIAGSAVPAWALPIDGSRHPNAMGALKLGIRVNDSLHVAAVIEVVSLAGLAGGTASALTANPYVSATWGDANAHLTLSAGAVGSLPTYGPAGPRFVVAGDLRLAPHVAAITENWFFFELPGSPSGRPLFSSLGLRLFGKSFAVDLGGVLLVWVWRSTPTGSLLVPWLDVTCNFN